MPGGGRFPATKVARSASIYRLALMCCLLLSGCVAVPDSTPRLYRVQTDCGTIRTCFTSIQAAVDAAQYSDPGKPVRIQIGPGEFNDKVTIRRPNLTLSGKGQDRTRLVNSLAAEHARSHHRANWGTPGSATLTIDAEDVTIEDIGVENSFDFLANDALPDGHARKIVNSQAVALLLDVNSDRVLLNRVALVGYHDTVFANGRRAVVRDSFISGTIDFVFGNGQLLIERSELQTRRRAGREIGGKFASFVLAPSTRLSDPVGIVIHRSRLTREAGVPDGTAALARPWHPTTQFPDGRYADPQASGQALFIDCFMDAHIHHEHWASMAGTARDGTRSAIYMPQDARFWEAGSYGPGARRIDIGMKWEPQLDIEAIRSKFGNGWEQFGGATQLPGSKSFSHQPPTQRPIDHQYALAMLDGGKERVRSLAQAAGTQLTMDVFLRVQDEEPVSAFLHCAQCLCQPSVQRTTRSLFSGKTENTR